MYYHSRELKHVEYDKVLPAPIEFIDEHFLEAYKWLGKYCGYCPQIWLSRSRSCLTGYKGRGWGKWENDKSEKIMFGFDVIKGFPLDFDTWELILGPLMNKEKISVFMKDMYKMIMEDGGDFSGDMGIKDYIEKGEDYFLKKYLFVEKDQVVVPSLNLKSAKIIFCKSEKHVKALRKMGFINDRIRIQK